MAESANHIGPVSIGTPDSKTKAWWSASPSRDLMLFIHGFGGGATATWRSFPQLLLGDPQFREHDFVFAQYHSQRATASASAALLYNFVDSLFSAPSIRANDYVPIKRRLDLVYERIFLIAHSLGAPVARRALFT